MEKAALKRVFTEKETLFFDRCMFYKHTLFKTLLQTSQLAASFPRGSAHTSQTTNEPCHGILLTRCTNLSTIHNGCHVCTLNKCTHMSVHMSVSVHT